MSDTEGPPAKRLRSHFRPNSPGPLEAADHSSSESELDDGEVPSDSSDNEDEEVDVVYEPHEIVVEPVKSAPSAQTSNVNSVAGSFILSLHEKCLASETDRKELLSDAKLLVKDCIKQFAVSVDNALKSKGLKFGVNDVMNVDKTAASTCFRTFQNLETKTQQEKYFKEILDVSEIRRIPLGKVFIRSRKGSVTKTKIVEQEMMYIPVEETVEKLLNHPDFKVFEKSESSPDLEVMDSYMKGELCKCNKVLQEHPGALRFILYYDDVELCSPLKSRAGKQKVGAFYIFIENIHPKFRSNLNLICLVALVNANFIKGKSYGMDAALQIIVDALKKFESGVILMNGQKIYGTLIATIGDGLAQHALGGFKERFTAYRCCRMCMARFEFEVKTMTRENEDLLRNKEEYEKQVEKIQTARGKNEKASREFGLNRASCLNDLESFHVLDNMPPDIMHDILEGSLSITLKRLLKYYLYDLEEKKFTLDWLNQRISQFDYDYSEIKDKPSELKEDYIKDLSTTSLHQSASQLWLLATILPLILRPHVDVAEEHWENFLDLLEICRMLFTLDFPKRLLTYLKDMIDKYLSTYIKLYGKLIPKQHAMVHFPRLILRLGSLAIYNCMRAEANHKYFKRVLSVISAFKNIPLFLARKDQLHQAYIWNKEGLMSATTTGPQVKVHLQSVFYRNLIQTDNGEVTESSWLKVNGIQFKQDRCYIVVAYQDHLPVFALIRKIIVQPEVVFVCEKVNTICRDVYAACFIVSLTDKFCVHQLHDMLTHSVFHAHKLGDELAIVSKYCIGGEP